MDEIHPLLKRQLKKFLGIEDGLPKDHLDFYMMVNESYWQADRDHHKLQRSLTISSQELFDRNTEMQAIFQTFPDAFFRIDHSGVILSHKISKQNEDVDVPEKISGENITKILGEEVSERFVQAIAHTIEQKVLISIEFDQKRNNQVNTFEARFLPFPSKQIIVIIRNITPYKQVLQALQQEQERYTLAMQGANDGMWDWDLETNMVYYSERWKHMMGLNGEVGSSPNDWFKRVHPADLNHLKVKIDSQLKLITSHLEVDYRFLHKDGIYRWVLTRGVSVRDKQGKVVRLVGSQTDITHRKLAEEQLRYDAMYDKLTGLPNRTLFLDRLQNLIARKARHANFKFAVLFIDFDRFKIVNDSFGHAVGDQLLVQISKRLSSIVRAGDTIARFGGDEFTLLMEEIETETDAVYFAERIQQVMKHPFILEKQDCVVSASIGIAIGAPHYEKGEDLLRDADIAMYRAKMKGKACHEIFNKEQHATAAARLSLEADIRRAIERQEFTPYYQPIASVKSGQILHMEALIRWHHPRRGVVSPVDFIPIAEETGLIVPIGESMFKMVCEQCKVWREAGISDVSVAINMSARQFQHQRTIGVLERFLLGTGVDPRMLAIEITESVAMKDESFSIQVLKKFKELGIQISIDDFGVGHSSLSSLKTFPIDMLKIDRSFIKNIPENENNVVLVQAIIAMAHGLGLSVVAEGIETKEQLAVMNQNGCDLIQGYLLSKPVPTEEATKILLSKTFDIKSYFGR